MVGKDDCHSLLSLLSLGQSLSHVQVPDLFCAGLGSGQNELLVPATWLCQSCPLLSDLQTYSRAQGVALTLPPFQRPISPCALSVAFVRKCLGAYHILLSLFDLCCIPDG